MSAPIHGATVQSRIGEGIKAARTRTTAASLARLLGCDRSTMARRGDDLADWSAKDLATLLAYDADLRQQTVEVLTEGEANGEPLAVEHDLRDLVRRSGRTIDHLMTRLEDQRITAAEARASIPELLELRESIDQALRDCRAREKAVRK